RRFAREIGVDVTQAEGTGPGGRITGDDIKALSRQTQATGGPSLPSQPLPDFANWGEIEVEAMSNLRRTAATHLARCWTTVPHVTQFDQADVSDLERYRKSLAKIAEAHGAKLTVTAILVKVVATALRKFPAFNSSVDMSTQSVIYKKYCNIGIAVDTPRGLIVPVVKNADQLGVLGIAVALTEISARARTGKTPLSDMQGGTFTISNLGGIGGTGFTPIVNWPEVAILGVARSQQQTIWVDGQPQPTTAMPLALSYDHRVIDGADGARFLRWICQALENPLLLSLEG
ncbi:MAG TPA: branched-chain alpha-keto acid dehydrogenase subunit E2, partial [Lentisphaeria bacterium]|nr:branched-chain alpha-keto acid dehydrogenase subunit E2 [Lentisphaeria bacterium]